MENNIEKLRKKIEHRAQQPPSVPVGAAERLAEAVKGEPGWSSLNPQARIEKARRYLALAHQPAAEDEVLTPTGTFCSVCEAPQHNTPSGVSCPLGHGGAEPLAAWPGGSADVELLPLPECAEIVGGVIVAMPIGGFNKHIRASIEANTEALRSELREAWSAVDSKAGWEWKKRAEQAEALAERLKGALQDLLGQFEGVGIYIPGEDSGQWAGTEGLYFMQAEAALDPTSRCRP